MFSGLKGQDYMAHALLMADQWSTRQQAKLHTLFSISAHVTSIHTSLDKSNYLVKWKILSGKHSFPDEDGEWIFAKYNSLYHN